MKVEVAVLLYGRKATLKEELKNARAQKLWESRGGRPGLYGRKATLKEELKK